MYTHISFDLWNTLINPNPEYNHQRILMISNELKIDYSVVEAEYKNIKKFLDKQAEYTGNCLSTDECWKLLVGSLIKPKEAFKIDDLSLKINSKADELFSKYKPILSTELVKEIRKLKGFDITVGIISNTNFTSGRTITKTLFNNKLFNTVTFSDQRRVAKPHREIFLYHYKSIYDYNVLDNCLHIGDNIICDGAATNEKLKFKLVSDPTDTLKFITELNSTLDKKFN